MEGEVRRGVKLSIVLKDSSMYVIDLAKSQKFTLKLKN